MTSASLESAVDAAWEARNDLSPATTGEARDAVETALADLDAGRRRGDGVVGGAREDEVVHHARAL
jgi:2,3,4,5-tetrahydropyridine-2-carboxylate N-succinyltransferase